ncbi:NUDIX hydrolase [uncultured Jatrophihabitans sp.]|uniref:NUDIX hydrolase n=1 Tax=uncultured Jatrophihabitans sp. TaxID=1610747 RepID=UPI0035CB8208
MTGAVDPPEAAPVHDAASVVLLRDGPAGVEVWLLTRVRQMSFAAGMSVFPGGRVDPADADLALTGADVSALAARFRCAEPTARALLGAAVRETFEETGVLLTVPSADLAAARADVESGRVAFGDLLRDHGLAADASGVQPWARWVTPVGEPRRYDTRFFVAALPAGVEAADVSTESSSAGWLPVGEALEQAQRGERMLLPPTLKTITTLLPFGSVAQVLAASADRVLDAVQPRLQVGDDGAVSVLMPDGEFIAMPARPADSALPTAP